MKASESLGKIAPALLAAQKAMRFAAKDSTNPHFKSKYADLATVIDAVKAPLNDAGITILQTVTNDTTGVMVQTTLLHESSEWVAETIYLPVPQQTPQAFGSAITYARRYSLQSLVTLPSEDDDGERASEPEKPDAHRVDRKDSARQVAVDAFDALPEETRKTVQNMAAAIIDLFENKEPTVPYINAHIKFDDQETRLALWSLLPSHVRSGIKKEQSALLAPKPKYTPTQLGGQA